MIEVFNVIKKLCRNINLFLGDFIFPRTTILEKLSKMSPQEIFYNCQKVTSHREGIHSIFSYKDELVKEMVWQIKFRGQKYYAKICGKFLAEKIKEIIDINIKHLLIPIPIHSKRRKERGFNQCERLCEGIYNNLNIAIKQNILYKTNFLIRKEYKIKQSWSSKKERVTNMSGAFSINPNIYAEISNKSIILIDDVITTGATVGEAKKILFKAGAKNIICITIAQ